MSTLPSPRAAPRAPWADRYRWVLLPAVTAAVYLPVALNWMCTDEAIFSVLALGQPLHGTPPYLTGFENKPPGVFLLYGLVYHLFGFGLWRVRLLWAAFVLATAGLIMEWLRGLVSRRAALAAGLAYPLVCALLVTGNAYTEVPLALATTLAFYLLWRGLRRPHPLLWLGSGVALGLALLCKQIAVCEVAAALLVLWWGRRSLPAGAVWGAVLLLGAGIALVWGATVAWLALTGQLAAFWFCVYTLTLAPEVSGHGAEAWQHFLRWWGPVLLGTSPLWAAALRGAWLRLPRQDQGAGRVIYAWLALALLGAIGSRQFWLHHTVQFLPPLFLAAAVGAVGLGREIRRRRLVWPLLAAVVLVVLAGAGAERHRYAAAGARLTGRADNVQADLGRWLAARVPPGETIYDVGREPEVYLYAMRLPASHYLWSALVTTPAARELVLTELQANRPRYICFSTLETPWDQALAEQIKQRFLPGNYVPVTEPRFPGFEVYARKDL